MRRARFTTEKHAPATRPLTAAPISCLDAAPPEPHALACVSLACEGVATQSSASYSTPPPISRLIPPSTNPHTAENRWNSNDPDSMFEIVVRELRATFWGSMRGMDSVCDSSAMDSAIASVTTRQTIQRRPKRRLATEKHTPTATPFPTIAFVS